MFSLASSNSTIAKNSLYLYLRMLVVMFVNLYMVRVLLVALGQEDYGLYTLVAGIINLLSFLNTTMSGATSRFLTYDLGLGDLKKVNETFRVAFFLHIGIALLLLVLAETIGLWFVNARLNVPEHRLLATNVIYQVATIAMLVKVLQVPFNASVLANEKMNIYAGIEIVYTFLLLGGVLLLSYYTGDRLIAYGVLLMVATILNALGYVIYGKMRLPECREVKPIYKKEALLPMLSFSGWDLYGNLCAAARAQGLAVLLNHFFGALLNAAAGVAGQIQAAVLAFTSAVTATFRPQIIKSYSVGDYERLQRLLGLSLTLGAFLFALVGVPIYFELPYILQLWLGTPPEHTYELARLMLVASFFGVLNSVLIIPIHATGRIKMLSFLGGTLHLLVLPLGYMLLLWDVHPTMVYWANVVGMFLSLVFSLVLLHRMLPLLRVEQLLCRDLFATWLCLFFSLLAPIATTRWGLSESFFRLCLTLGVYAVWIAALFYTLKLSASERGFIKHWVVQKLSRRA